VQVLYRDMIDRLVEPPHRAKHRFVTFKGDGNWLAQAQQAGNVQEEAIPKAILETDRQALVLRTSSGADAKRIQVFGSMKDVDPQRQVPTDVCVDPSNGNVYITMGAKNSISILSKDGNLIGHLGDFASSESELNTPCGVTVFGENVLVSDSGNHRIVVYNKLSRKQIQTFGAQGTIPGKLRRPMQLCTSISGNVIVADSANRRAAVWDLHNARFLCCAGGAAKGQVQSFKSAVQAVAVTADGTILVADSIAATISLFKLASCSTSISGVRAVLEKVIGGPCVLGKPMGMLHTKMEQGEAVLICDSERNCITSIDMDGALIIQSPSGLVAEPWSIALNLDGAMIVTEHTRTLAKVLTTLEFEDKEGNSAEDLDDKHTPELVEQVPNHFRQLLELEYEELDQEMAEDELCKAIALAEAQLDVFEGRNSSVGSSPTASPSISPFDTPRVFDTPRAMEHVFSANGDTRLRASSSEMDFLHANNAELRFVTLVEVLLMLMQDQQIPTMISVFIEFSHEFSPRYQDWRLELMDSNI